MLEAPFHRTTPEAPFHRTNPKLRPPHNEGVETITVARLLAEWGAETLQGYLLSPLLAPAAFEEWLAHIDLRDLASVTHERRRMLQLAR